MTIDNGKNRINPRLMMKTETGNPKNLKKIERQKRQNSQNYRKNGQEHIFIIEYIYAQNKIFTISRGF